MRKHLPLILTAVVLGLIGTYAFPSTTIDGARVITSTLNVNGVATLANGAVLGTPASGDATNLTNIPVANAKSGSILPGANGGGMVLISHQALAMAAATVTFSSIPATYKTLKVFIQTRCDTNTTQEDAYLQFNADTAANYSRQYLLANQAAPTVGQELSVAKIGIFTMPCLTGFASGSAITEITIPNYAGTTFLKVGTSHVVDWTGAAQATFTNQDFGFYWASATAINAILFGNVAGGGNFVANSVFDLYGLN